MDEKRLTLRQQISRHLSGRPPLASDLGVLLDSVARIAKALTAEIRRAPFRGRLGLAGGRNVSGEEQKKLDVLANGIAVGAVSSTGLVAAILSEEMDEPLLPEGAASAPYVLCIDPIDGSSNTDINGSLGTIFGFSRRAQGAAVPGLPGGLPRGSDLLASGYVLYGPGTLLVYTAGDGVFGFTLDEERDEFFLSHDSIRCPAHGNIYSANLGRQQEWHPNIRRYLDYLTGRDPETRRPYSLRYIGALVADLHRSLVDGGIYFYPPDPGHREGKLRLLYECAPLAFLIEQAGGRASTGEQRILDVETRALHQRSPLVIGSAEEVTLYESFLKQGKPS